MCVCLTIVGMLLAYAISLVRFNLLNVKVSLIIVSPIVQYKRVLSRSALFVTSVAVLDAVIRDIMN